MTVEIRSKYFVVATDDIRKDVERGLFVKDVCFCFRMSRYLYFFRMEMRANLAKILRLLKVVAMVPMAAMVEVMMMIIMMMMTVFKWLMIPVKKMMKLKNLAIIE